MTQSNETVEQLVSAVRRFVREQLLPAEPKVKEDDDIPDSSWGKVVKFAGANAD